MIKKKRIVHILKNQENHPPLDQIRAMCKSSHVFIILIQRATEMEISDIDGSLFVLSDDLKPDQASPYRQIGYKEMLDLIFECDAVVTW